ncbi:MAG: hypothetical protein GYA24_13705 [Candidatus Lokiarchaeota archaeon]|nr:hypothetical protein [Candidatus Lokiarchaeota archaeon]
MEEIDRMRTERDRIQNPFFYILKKCQMEFDESCVKQVVDMGYSRGLTSLCFSRDSKFIACGKRGGIYMFHTRTGEISTHFKSEILEKGIIRSIDFSRDGKYIVAGDNFGRVFVWEVFSKKLIWYAYENDRKNRIIYISAGLRLDDNHVVKNVVACSGGGKIIVYDIESGAVVKKIEGITDSSQLECRVTALSFSPNCQFLLYGLEIISHNRAELYCLETKKLARSVLIESNDCELTSIDFLKFCTDNVVFLGSVDEIYVASVKIDNDRFLIDKKLRTVGHFGRKQFNEDFIVRNGISTCLSSEHKLLTILYEFGLIEYVEIKEDEADMTYYLATGDWAPNIKDYGPNTWSPDAVLATSHDGAWIAVGNSAGFKIIDLQEVKKTFG